MKTHLRDQGTKEKRKKNDIVQVLRNSEGKIVNYLNIH